VTARVLTPWAAEHVAPEAVLIRLHYYPGNASMTPHILLHELQLSFELEFVDRTRDAQRSPEYLRLNPNGTIPVLVDGELVLYETAAIVLHLVDTHPEAGLAPALGTAERAHFYKWLIWSTNTLQAELMVYAYPERWLGEANAAIAPDVRRQAQLHVGGMLHQLESHFAAHGGPWMLGERFSALDPFVFMLCRWTRGFDASVAPPARARPAINAFLQRMLERPSVQQVVACEQLSAPLV
jgi:glutathione S-transferase